MIGLTVLLGFAVGSTGGASPGMEVVVRVAPSPVARVSPAFLSFTIDSAALRPIHCRWPCPDTADTSGVLAERVRHLSPMVLRVGGTSADNLEWAGDGAKPLPALPAVARAFGPQGNITTAKLDALMRFAEAVGGELVLGLNALLRVNASGTAQWDPRNARGLLRAVASARSPGSVTAFELGNEPGYWAGNGWSGLSAAQHTADFVALKAEIAAAFALHSNQPLVAGPDVAMTPGGGDARYLAKFWGGDDVDVVDIATIHQYALIRNGVAATYPDFYNATRLNACRENTRAARAIVPRRTALWVGEGSPDWRVTGELGRNLTFETGFVDMAGSIAAGGGALFARQCLNSVIGPNDVVEPGFWTMLLWKRLMGETVWNATVVGAVAAARPVSPQGDRSPTGNNATAGPVRVYCHSTPKQGRAGDGSDLTALIINLGADPASVTVALPASVGRCVRRDEYHLGPGSAAAGPAGGATTITVNGVVPRFSGPNSSALPAMLPRSVEGCVNPVTLAPRAFAFIVLRLGQ